MNSTFLPTFDSAAQGPGVFYRRTLRRHYRHYVDNIIAWAVPAS